MVPPQVGAIDIESKFTEAALGSIQLADFRNFAHGRHHWLAKRGSDSSVLAFVAPEDRALAERTLALIPKDIPQVVIDLPESSSTSLASLLMAFRLTGLAGSARGIDPGRPGVPMFGRHLYRLKPPRIAKRKSQHGLSSRDEVAIERKSSNSIAWLEESGSLKVWQQHLARFQNALFSHSFQAIVLDYDGTIVETQYRQNSPEKNVSKKLIEMLEANIWVCVATGRGKSVRQAMQSFIPKQYWEKVLVGYYNGAEVGSLGNDEIPDGRPEVGEALQNISEILKKDQIVSEIAFQENRKHQITMTGKKNICSNHLFECVTELLMRTQSTELKILQSGHSIDILPPNVSKLSVGAALQTRIPDISILAIGDSGGLNGNDHELLTTPFSLGVDKVSSDPRTCWNLGSRGQRGPEVLTEYLTATECMDGYFKLQKEALK